VQRREEVHGKCTVHYVILTTKVPWQACRAEEACKAEEKVRAKAVHKAEEERQAELASTQRLRSG